uniref:Uncharacterized protein n=1 Tax=Salix viminalis TaxID=40686 RepID=A0A6N2NEY0_SALVM
MNQTRKQLLL